MNYQFSLHRDHSMDKHKLSTNGSGKLYIGNLGFLVQEQEVKQEFE